MVLEINVGHLTVTSGGFEGWRRGSSQITSAFLALRIINSTKKARVTVVRVDGHGRRVESKW